MFSCLQKHSNAAQTLCDIIRLSREQMSQLQEKAEPDPLLNALESYAISSNIIDFHTNYYENPQCLRFSHTNVLIYMYVDLMS